MESAWKKSPFDLEDEGLSGSRVLEAYREVHRLHFAGSPGTNESLGFRVRANRRIEQWRAMLLLTPWMFARLWLAASPPALPDSVGGVLRETEQGGFRLLGATLSFSVLGQEQQGHLAYHRLLGHHLLQPLVFNLHSYHSAEAVFEAWNEVIRVRDESLRGAARECPLQREISRRELFRRFVAGSEPD